MLTQKSEDDKNIFFNLYISMFAVLSFGLILISKCILTFGLINNLITNLYVCVIVYIW